MMLRGTIRDARGGEARARLCRVCREQCERAQELLWIRAHYAIDAALRY